MAVQVPHGGSEVTRHKPEAHWDDSEQSEFAVRVPREEQLEAEEVSSSQVVGLMF
jgi:hypothetical protein